MKFYRATIVIGNSEIPCAIGIWDNMKVPEKEDSEKLYIRIEESIDKNELKNNELSVLFPKARNTLSYLLETDDNLMEIHPCTDPSLQRKTNEDF